MEEMIMKKTFALFVACAAAALALVSCQKVNNAPASVEKTVHFTAQTVDTKTAFGALEAGVYPTLWTANDSKVKISLNYAAAKEADVTVDPTNAGAATFAAEFTDDSSGDYTFYAVSPATAANGFNSTYSSIYFTVPSSQTPLAGSVEEASQILVAKSASVATFPGSVDFSFSHLTAYGKISFANLTLDGDENIASVSLTAEQNWAGAFYYYPGDGSITEHATAPKSKTIMLNTTSSTDIWFACVPVDLSGTDITVVIATNKGTYTKVITVPDGKPFVSGQIAVMTIDMNGIARVSPEVWQKTPLASITSSDIFVITCTKTDSNAGVYALPNDAPDTSAPGATAVTVSGDTNTLTGVVADNLKWNLTSSVIEEVTYYTFYPNGVTTKWLVLKNANNGVRIVDSENADASHKWITLDPASGYLKAQEYARYVGVYLKQDWRCYNSATATNIKDQTFAFYVKQ